MSLHMKSKIKCIAEEHLDGNCFACLIIEDKKQKTIQIQHTHTHKHKHTCTYVILTLPEKTRENRKQ